MAFHLTTSIDIGASPDQVWNVLTDFGRYAEWNPFIHPAAGEPRVGAKLDVSIAGTRFRPRVLVADPTREFRWLGRLGFRGIFDGEHYFILADNRDGTTTLEQGEHFSGLLLPLLRKKLETDTRAGFIAMNEALRKRVEIAGGQGTAARSNPHCPE